MAPASNSNESYCTFTLASDVTAGGLPSEAEIAKDLESNDANVRRAYLNPDGVLLVLPSRRKLRWTFDEDYHDGDHAVAAMTDMESTCKADCISLNISFTRTHRIMQNSLFPNIRSKNSP